MAKTLDDIYEILNDIKDILIEANVNTIETVSSIDDLPDTKIIKVVPVSDKLYKIKYRK